MQHSQTHLRTRPISAGHLRAFEAVARHLNFRAAAEEMALTQSAVSRQIQHLVDLGLLDRQPDPADGRAMLLSLTDDARAGLARVQAERSERFDRRLGELTTAELVAFADQLGRYNSALENPELG